MKDVLSKLKETISKTEDRPRSLNEATTIKVLVEPVLETLGWDLRNPDECVSEYRHTSRDNPVDLSFFLKRQPVLFIEAKQLGLSLDDRKWAAQAVAYANASGVKWAVLTNGREWRVYNAHAETDIDGKQFFSIDLAKSSSDEAETLLGLLSRTNMVGSAIDAAWQSQKIDAEVREQFASLLEDGTLARTISKKLDRITLAEVKASLHRADIGISHPSGHELLTLAATPSSAPCTVVDAPPAAPVPRPKRPMRVKEMLERGLLHDGQVLRIRGRQGSDATLQADGNMFYKGNSMSPSVWGCRVTGWSAIQIYVRAETADGQLLDDIRKDGDQ